MCFLMLVEKARSDDPKLKQLTEFRNIPEDSTEEIFTNVHYPRAYFVDRELWLPLGELNPMKIWFLTLPSNSTDWRSFSIFILNIKFKMNKTKD